jgi:ParB family chromosome partitioning protein
MDRFGHTQEKIAQALSKSRSHIANLLRLLQLPEDVQMMIQSGTLSAGHARALISTENPIELAQKIVGGGLSVRQAEQLVKDQRAPKQEGAAGKSRNLFEKDADTRALERDLSSNLKMLVSIDHEPGGEKGILKITYNTLEDLDRLCRILSEVDRDLD